MPSTFDQEEQREAAASHQQEEQHGAFLGKGAIPKKRKTKDKKPEDAVAAMFLEEAGANQPSISTKEFVFSKISKASQKCEQLTAWSFQDIGFFLAGTVFIFCIFVLVRNVAFSNSCTGLEGLNMIDAPKMDEKVLNDFILESSQALFGGRETLELSDDTFDLEHPSVTRFVDSLRIFKQQLLNFQEEIGSKKTKIIFIE